MNKRLRPVTYAESLEAKEYAEENEIQQEELTTKPIKEKTSSFGVEVKGLPSGGKSYPEKSTISYIPLSFGEMKYLSKGDLSDLEDIEFFLSKIDSSFDVKLLTYYDFYFITVLIKMATFGDTDYTVTYECYNCGHKNKATFGLTELEFEEIRVPLPVNVEGIRGQGEETLKASFVPTNMKGYTQMLKDGTQDDYDYIMANCVTDDFGTFEEKLKLIKNNMAGLDVNILESIDVSFFHGVKSLEFKCNGVLDEDGVLIEETKAEIKPKGYEEVELLKSTSEKSDITVSKEVCGSVHHIPFLDITKYISTEIGIKGTLRDRINFGV